LGISFDYPETLAKGVKWLGRGPYRVWKNRMAGPADNVWQKGYIDPKTGQQWVYPEFKGYHANLYWAKLETWEGDITIATDTEDMFLRLFKPANSDEPRNTAVKFPGGDIAFLQAITPIGTKFTEAEDLGPSGQPTMIPQDAALVKGTLYFYFGDR
jgi:hypothetical protein